MPGASTIAGGVACCYHESPKITISYAPAATLSPRAAALLARGDDPPELSA